MLLVFLGCGFSNCIIDHKLTIKMSNFSGVWIKWLHLWCDQVMMKSKYFVLFPFILSHKVKIDSDPLMLNIKTLDDLDLEREISFSFFYCQLALCMNCILKKIHFIWLSKGRWLTPYPFRAAFCLSLPQHFHLTCTEENIILTWTAITCLYPQ